MLHIFAADHRFTFCSQQSSHQSIRQRSEFQDKVELTSLFKKLGCMSKLEFRLLGAPSFLVDGEIQPALRSRTAEALLIYLACEPGPISRELLAEFFWEGRTQTQSASNLRTALAMLRRQFGEFLEITRQTVTLRPDADVHLDLDSFLTAFDRHESWPASQGFPMDKGQLQHTLADRLRDVLAVYRGVFLEGLALPGAIRFDEWAALRRERYDRLAVRGLSWLADYTSEVGRFAESLEIVSRWSALDPYDEAAVRLLMDLYARNGTPHQATLSYQQLHARLEADLGVEPAWSTQDAWRRIRSLKLPPAQKLPHASGEYIERSETDALKQLLMDRASRLVSLVGPGGAGKTRLALHAAAELGRDHSGRFLDGLFFVPLASGRSASDLLTRTADVLGLTLESSRVDELIAYLANKEALILLDNLEHLLDEQVLGWIEALSAAAPQVKFLICSRSALNLQREVLVPISGLALPEQDDEAPLSYPAGRLFVQSAQRALPGFAAQAEEYAAIAQICRLLDGLPLGLELAGSWIRLHRPADIATQIEADLDFLTARHRDRPERHRSLRAVFDHSWQLLNATQRQALSGLSIFPGRFRLDWAQAVLNAPDAHALRSDLAALIDGSLVQSASSDLSLHPLVRSFAAEQLKNDSDFVQTVQTQHARWALHIAAVQLQRHENGEEQAALTEVESHLDDIRLALDFTMARDDADQLEKVWRILYLFLWVRNRLDEGHQFLGRLLKVPGFSTETRVEIGIALAEFEMWLGEFKSAKNRLDDLEEAASQSDARVYGDLLETLGRYYNHTFDYQNADRVLSQALEILRPTDDKGRIAQVLNSRAIVLCELTADYGPAVELFEESLSLYRQIRDSVGIAKVLLNMGTIEIERDHVSLARELLLESIALYRQVDYPYGVWAAHSYLGDLATRSTDFEAALVEYQQALATVNEIGNRSALLQTLIAMADLESQINQPGAARHHLSQALKLGQEMGVPGLKLKALASIAQFSLAVGKPALGVQVLDFVTSQEIWGQEDRNRLEQRLVDVSAQMQSAELKALRVNNVLSEDEAVEIAQQILRTPSLAKRNTA
jgi:predicted ATPase/DNA-binding SARP family transcriptional activator